MALKILASCINCDMCDPECPNQAITLGEEVYEIDPARCTECLGHYDEPTCVKVCPIDCVVPDPEHEETEETLVKKFELLYQLDVKSA
ncbi:YfhL family 4Fe-4S dicluster ferredoxin [Thalassotalea euphylliae]|uniref:4Fe-4S dicluster domain-containing protein n=1 Tax=Thalassotalea euphylliae TaxID=1655234 RepID=A0A3E0UIG5_9GAMM|nr:YfhL family 4Fe-4S dicluster ferredoxin [Thalassotalea euphylliae]REL36417.1 4Fe-4S dicluster domain-containing protein [Thalassotalea euphylliae]